MHWNLFQEKEYPDKVDQIKNLKQEVDILEQEFLGEYSELEETAITEKSNYKADANILQDDVKAELAEVFFFYPFKFFSSQSFIEN